MESFSDKFILWFFIKKNKKRIKNKTNIIKNENKTNRINGCLANELSNALGTEKQKL